jgi:polar amino acid transport system substrate-binding protein
MNKKILTLALLLPLISSANCSRLINVPVSPTGLSVTTSGDEIGGIYPDILRQLEKTEDCRFQLSVVPRARQEVMFKMGKADLLIPASKTPQRDEYGIFVPLVRNRATLISFNSNRPTISSFQDLLDSPELRLVLVRGFDYGVRYQNLIIEMSKRERLILEPDPLSVARTLKTNNTFLSIMAPSIFYGAVIADTRVADMLDKLRYEALNELPWGESGVYISKISLTEADRKKLQTVFEYSSNSDLTWKGFQRVYPSEVLKESIRSLRSKDK